ncbi:MAG: hypothetical protein WBI14_09915 [Anaerolineaceae bacterium]
MSSGKSIKFIILLLVVLSACNHEVYKVPAPTKAQPTPTLLFQSTNTPENIQLPVDSPTVAVEDPPYTIDNPATTQEEITPLINVIQERYLSAINKPGWYTSGMPLRYSAWVYISDPETKSVRELFTMMSVINYSNPQGNVIVGQMLLPDGKDGTFGLNDQQNDTIITRLGQYSPTATYTMGGDFPPYFFLLENYFLNVLLDNRFFKVEDYDKSPYKFETTTRVWLSGEGENCLLEIEIHSVGLGGRKNSESDARQTEVTTIYQFNWTTGDWVSFYQKQHYTDGTDFVTILDEEWLSKYKYQYYKSLPAKVQQLYDDAARKVREAYAAQGMN